MNDEAYSIGKNDFTDYFMELLYEGYDISDPELIGNTNIYFSKFLMNKGISENDLLFFDFKIIRGRGESYKVKANNIVTAMWLSGFFPENCNLLFEKNRVIFDGKIFKFNRKTKKLSWVEKE